MGQRNSTTITKPYESIEPIESNEWTNYMEWTNFKNLKIGEKYRLIIECYEFEFFVITYLMVNMVIVKIVMQCLKIQKNKIVIIITQMFHGNIINSYQKKNTMKK